MKVANLIKKSVAGMEPYDSSPVLAVPCKLDQNESPYDVPASVKQKIMRRIASAGFNRYPDLTYSSLRGLIAKMYGVKLENVAVGSGIDDLLYCASLAFLSEGDEALYFTPTFGMYRICCQVAGAKETAVPLNTDFSLPREFFEKSRKAKLVFICRPNNPTGTTFPRESIERIAREAKGIVLIDEAYAEFADDDCLSLLKYPNVIVFRTMSKAFCSAGVRIGCALGSREAIAAINKVRLPWNIGALSLIAAEESLKNRRLFAKNIKTIKSERARLLSQIRALGMNAYDSQANFILFEPADAKLAFDWLLNKGILVRRFSSKQMAKFLRVSVGTPAENDRFLQCLPAAAADAVLFDLDSTLVDVSKSYLEAIQLTAEEISGKSVSRSLVLAVKSMPNMNNDWDATAEALRRLGVKSTLREVVPIFQKIYLGKGGNGLIRNEKPLASFRLLKSIGKPIGIVTGRPLAEARLAMGMLGLPKNTPLVAMEDTKKGKPSPAPLLLAKKMMGAKLPIYIGDSPDDCTAANAAGMAFVAIGKGEKRKGEFARFKNAEAAIRGLFS